MTFHQWFENESGICKSDLCRDAALAGWVAGGADVMMKSVEVRIRTTILDVTLDRKLREDFSRSLVKRGYDGFDATDIGMILDALYEAKIAAEDRANRSQQ